jgi:hypothetical protein
MTRFPDPPTLRLKRPVELTLVFALLLLPLFFGALELFLRVDALQPYIVRLIPSLGGRHLQMEEQLGRLERFAATEGHVDCIFLGSSLVWLGFDPPVFETAYADATGHNIRCFNLGIEALPTSAANPIAQFVLQKYHPWLLIYGTSARDYAIDTGDEDSRVIFETPGLQYQLGKRTPWNWLVSNSYVVRYMSRLGDLLRFDEDALQYLRSSSAISQGFLGKTVPPQEVHFQAAARDAARFFRPYEVRPVNVEALGAIARQRHNGSQVVVVEMPVSAAYFAYMEQGKKDYDRFVSQVSDTLSAEGTIFLRSSPDLIPDAGWWDRSHMNMRGADIFSQWLAKKIADLVAAGEINAPGARGEQRWEPQR